MILQNIIFPGIDTCTEELMYFRDYLEKGNFEYYYGREYLKFKKGCCISFDTYFNSFSAGKWYKYTDINTVKLTLRLSGKFCITLMRKYRALDGETIIEVIDKQYVDESFPGNEYGEYTFEYASAEPSGMYCFELKALSGNAKMYGGYYSSDVPEKNIKKVKVAIDICTFKREKYILKNIEKLKKRFLENKDSYLYDKLMVFISDNAHTLDADNIATDKVRIFKNKNVGGAGGFTRGLIEIKDVKEKEKITHVLVMDDDLTIEPESIFRTVSMLSILKDEYKDSFIGGSMIRLDCRYRQVESGAAWNSGEIIAFKANIDLRTVESCLYNEVEESAQYNAWWYCVFPVGVVSDKNLPMPIFIRGDDIEYGLRNMKNLILLNGICVWHEPFENKYSSFLFYYILRNRLIDNSIHNMPLSKEEVIALVRSQVLDEVRLYRYKNAELLMKGTEDFLNGIEWLKSQDGEKLHKTIMAEGYKLKPVDELEEKLPFMQKLYDKSVGTLAATGFKARLINHFTLNGLYLKPVKQYNIVPVLGVQQSAVYRYAVVMNYDRLTGKAFVTKHDKAAAKACVKRLKALIKRIKSDYDRAVKEYNGGFEELSTREFWNKYLGI